MTKLISFTALVVLTLLALLGLTLIWESKGSASVNRIPVKIKRTTCFALIDSRIKEPQLEIVNFNATHQITNFIAQELDKPSSEQSITQYWTLQLLLVKHYAIKHGYKVFVSTGKAYDAKRKELGQNDNWGRLHFLDDIMNNRNATSECEWFAYFDSDAYPWLKAHTTSLEDYFSTQRLAVESYNYKERELQFNRTGKYDPWHRQNESFIIGLNWEPKRPATWPVKVVSIKDKLDYICSGIFFVRNNSIGKQLIRDWLYGAEDYSSVEREIHSLAGHKEFAWDQWAFNYGVSQRYFNVTNFEDFHFRFEGGFRHVWSQYNSDRAPMMKGALKDLDLWPVEKVKL